MLRFTDSLVLSTLTQHYHHRSVLSLSLCFWSFGITPAPCLSIITPPLTRLERLGTFFPGM